MMPDEEWIHHNSRRHLKRRRGLWQWVDAAGSTHSIGSFCTASRREKRNMFSYGAGE